MKDRITQRDIPSLEEGTYTIGSGLYLRKRGKYANFFLRVQVGGKRRDIAIGSASEVTLAVAKTSAEKIRSQIKGGEYVWKKDVKRIPTFEEFFAEAFEFVARSRQWTPGTTHARKRLIETYILPVFQKFPVDEITREDILDLIHDRWYESPDMGNRLRYTMEALLSVAIAKGYRQTNPATWKNGLSLFLPPRSKVHKAKHHDAMSFTNAARMLRHAMLKDDYGSYRAIIVAILTARRLREIVNARWEDFDFETGVWTVPDENMKIKRQVDRRVPLPSQLNEMICRWSKERLGEYICTPPAFAKVRGGRRGETSALSITAPLRVLKMAASTFTDEPCTIHGFRSTFTDWCAERMEQVELVELSLDHSRETSVRRAYFRSDLLEQRRGLLQRYADALFAEMERIEREEEE